MRALLNLLKALWIIIILILIFLVSVKLFFELFFDPSKVEIEQTVIEKRAEKGLFWSPLYKVITDDDPYGSYIPKKYFDQLKIGDKVKGYSTDESSFYTIFDLIYSSFILLPIIVLLGFFIMVPLIGGILHIPMIERAINRREARRKPKQPKKRYISLSGAILTLYILFALCFVSLYSWNIFNKVNPFSKTKTVAYIADRDKDINFNVNGNFSTYTLVLEYKDPVGREYIVEKQVTSSLYNRLLYEPTVDIAYVTKQPYNVFVQDYSPFSLLWLLFKPQSILYGINVLGLYYFYVIYCHSFVHKMFSVSSEAK